jgi:hypothetical protein
MFNSLNGLIHTRTINFKTIIYISSKLSVVKVNVYKGHNLEFINILVSFCHNVTLCNKVRSNLIHGEIHPLSCENSVSNPAELSLES